MGWLENTGKQAIKIQSGLVVGDSPNLQFGSWITYPPPSSFPNGNVQKQDPSPQRSVLAVSPASVSLSVCLLGSEMSQGFTHISSVCPVSPLELGLYRIFHNCFQKLLRKECLCPTLKRWVFFHCCHPLQLECTTSHRLWNNVLGLSHQPWSYLLKYGTIWSLTDFLRLNQQLRCKYLYCNRRN